VPWLKVRWLASTVALAAAVMDDQRFAAVSELQRGRRRVVDKCHVTPSAGTPISFLCVVPPISGVSIRTNRRKVLRSDTPLAITIPPGAERVFEMLPLISDVFYG
jgi:hypothetical protein